MEYNPDRVRVAITKWQRSLAAVAAVVAFSFAAVAQEPALPAPAPQPQTTPLSLPEWDVVSVKPADQCPTGSGMQVLQDGLHIFCLPARALIQIAWGISEPSRILNLPPWATELSFNIDARVAAQDVAAFSHLQPERRNQMLQALIEDRLGLKQHLVSRELPVYQLVVAGGGPKMKQATPEEAAKQMMWMRNRGEIDAVSMPIHSLRPMLARELDRPVVDNTGLAGLYDFVLKFTPAMSVPTDLSEEAPPSLFTAIQEQLGLKLEPSKAPLDVLVIDALQKPGEN